MPRNITPKQTRFVENTAYAKLFLSATEPRRMYTRKCMFSSVIPEDPDVKVYERVWTLSIREFGRDFMQDRLREEREYWERRREKEHNT